MDRRKFLDYAVGSVSFAALGVGITALTGCQGSDQGASFKSIDITGANDYAKDFRLTDHNGVVRSLTDFKGKVVTLFFGYLNCPDFCPTHLMRQKEVLRLLGSEASHVQTLFVTVDPERDTAAALKAYMNAFDPSFLGLRGSLTEVDKVAHDFKAYYRKVPTDKSGSYTMEHTTITLAFDPKSRLRLAIRHELPAADVASDLKTLLHGT